MGKKKRKPEMLSQCKRKGQKLLRKRQMKEKDSCKMGEKNGESQQFLEGKKDSNKV